METAGVGPGSERVGAGYRRTVLVTLAAVYFLILVGGVVRASGSGMGCPDWPRCFGRWIPPTSEADLPADYQEVYADRGYDSMRFNVVKTWTEYVNRLVGVTIGLCVFATLAASLPYLRRDGRVVAYSAAAFVLVGFQGWLGSVVVATNLHGAMVTLHMLMALLLVMVLLLALGRATRRVRAEDGAPGVSTLVLFCLALSVAQVILGTRVREGVDVNASLFGEHGRDLWVMNLGPVFLTHRSFSLVVLAANSWLCWSAWGLRGAYPGLWRETRMLVALAGLGIVTGAALYYGGMPAALQPVHLLLASLLFGVQFHLLTGGAVSWRRPPRPVEAPSAG